MRALVKEGRGVELADVRRPRVNHGTDVLVRVVLAGICRTDLYAASGEIACREPVILGHEFAGVVVEVGDAVERVRVGQHVTAMPFVRCGDCRTCRRSDGSRCCEPRMLGVDVDGAFAEYVCVPEELLYVLPEQVPFRHGAYVEPVAASMAVRQAELDRASRGLVYGTGRIAELTMAVLRADGFEQVALVDPRDGRPPEAQSYDFVVETAATADDLQQALRALVPGGTLVLKSRPPEPVAIDLNQAVQKEITLRAVRYAPFEDAIVWLAERRLAVDHLLGPEHGLESFAQVFDALRRDESRKHFFRMIDGDGGY